MAESSNYHVKFRRRRDQQTDYNQRLNLLKSGKPRAVIRLSNRHTRVHLANYRPEGDENEAQTVSKELEEFGWEHSTGNVPAAYLTGYLAGHRAESEEAILDMGLKQMKTGGRVFAALKGLIDAGVDINVGEEVLPEESRLYGEHIEEMKDISISDDVETVKENIEGEFE